MLVLTEYPLALSDQKAVNYHRKQHEDEVYDCWMSCPSQLEQILSILFKWKNAIHGRAVLCASGGTGCSLETVIKDVNDSTVALHALSLGPFTGQPSSFPFPLEGIVIPEAFSFRHEVTSSVPRALAFVHVHHIEESRQEDEKVRVKKYSKINSTIISMED